jgi:S1-C subfamily serine protease
MEISLVGRSKGAGAEETDAGKQVCFDQQKGALNLLGMTLTEIRPHVESSSEGSSRRGVEVFAASRDSDACRGGIRSGDIIAEINNTKVGSLQDIMKVLRLHDPHDPLLVLASNREGSRCFALSFIKMLH